MLYRRCLGDMNWLLSSYHDAKTHIARNAQSQRDGKFPHSLHTIKGEIFTMETEISRTRGLWGFSRTRRLWGFSQPTVAWHLRHHRYTTILGYGNIWNDCVQGFSPWTLRYNFVSLCQLSYSMPSPSPLDPAPSWLLFPFVFLCVYIWTSLQYLVSLFLLVSVLPSLF